MPVMLGFCLVSKKGQCEEGSLLRQYCASQGHLHHGNILSLSPSLPLALSPNATLPAERSVEGGKKREEEEIQP